MASQPIIDEPASGTKNAPEDCRIASYHVARHNSWRRAVETLCLTGLLLVCLPVRLRASDTVHLAIPTNSFQHVLYPIARDREYMEQEGIDLRIVLVAPSVSIQGLMTKSIHFTLAGTSALIARSRSGAPVKVLLAANKQVLQWVLTRPEIVSADQLRGRKIATPGVASSSTYMTKQALAKHGLSPEKDAVFLDPGAGNHLKALLAGAVDGAILGAEQRYVALNAGMKELFFLGNEVKNSWGTLATSDRLLQEDRKLVFGFLKATLKSLKFIRHNRNATIAAIAKFSQVDARLAGRVYDDLIGTFTTDGAVDEETQKNDLAIIRQVTGVSDIMPIERAYDFSLARAADRELMQSAWHP
jgi:ABC-type nitrate/sulfonate/bicarbonate transport system substrate-binding protein